MVSIETLHLLIHSLTKSEKRYFKLSTSIQGGEKDYLTLFNCLDRHLQFTKELSRDLHENFTTSALETARKYLYKTLMRSLRQFGADKIVEDQLQALLSDSRILFDRGLIEASLEQLDKAKTIALKYEKFIYYILASRQEIQYIISQQFVGWDEAKLVEKQEKISELLRHELVIQHHASLYEIVSMRYWKTGIVRSRQETLRLNDLLLEEHQVLSSQNIESFESKQLHLQFQSAYFLMTDSPQDSLQMLYELDSLFQSHSHLWADKPLYYMHVVNNALQTMRVTQQYEKMDYFLGQMLSISTTSDTLKLTTQCQVIENQLHVAVNTGNYQQASQLISHNQDLIEKDLYRLPLQIQVQLKLSIARVYYHLGNYSEALRIINQILNQPTRSLSRILYVSCRLMNLMIHVALENRDYIHYELRSIELRLKRQKTGFRVEQLFLKTLRHWLKNNPLKQFSRQFSLLKRDPFERQVILELGLEEWFSKVDAPSG
ncbi:hypothetical protein GCM10028803_21590 [Larkinella knui]|uniref:Uncharacterized protein n=1 Tax=Larkinella knui TaxID=2025310 RepID=A0A3P1CVZ3_9BACT|nr:hypothetical protein [Larkinella knui]RRB17240.1 hypothetical protein EHT87_02865 [Larkinella knui]